MTLPKGWVAAKILDFTSINPKHAGETNRRQKVSFVPMPAVDEDLGSIMAATDRILSEVWSGYTHFANGDVIFAKITPCMENGKIAVASGLTNGLACGSTEFYVLRTEGENDPDFLWRFLRQKRFRQEAERHMSGAVGQRRVPRSYIENYKVPLPPRNEQRRIASKLNALTDCIARVRAELNRLPTLAESLRQSIITDAFVGWPRTSLQKISMSINYGYTASASHAGPGSKFLRITDIQNRSVNWDTVPYVQLPKDDIQHCRLQTGDIVFARSGATVGKSFLVANPPADAVFASYLIRVRIDSSKLHPEIAAFYFQSSEYWAQIRRGATGTGQPNFNGSKLAALMVPVADEGEQKRAISKIARAFTLAGQLEAEFLRVRELLNRLEAAILAKAFRGELVPQDPNDEPASVLLERIRAQRAAEPKQERARRANKPKQRRTKRAG